MSSFAILNKNSLDKNCDTANSAGVKRTVSRRFLVHGFLGNWARNIRKMNRQTKTKLSRHLFFNTKLRVKSKYTDNERCVNPILAVD